MLSRKAILAAMDAGDIIIDPFVPEHVGPNSVDIRVGNAMKVFGPSYRPLVRDPVHGGTFRAIDPQKPPELQDLPRIQAHHLDLVAYPDSVTAEGAWLLDPSQFYLGETLECFGAARHYVPVIDGRSTAGRLGMQCHMTAGVGDVGFVGNWTLEITVQEPLIVRPGDRLLQVYFFPCESTAWQQAAVAYRKLEAKDLYGGGSHHYDNQSGVRGPAPLDAPLRWRE